jgi:hypothetical protein
VAKSDAERAFLSTTECKPTDTTLFSIAKTGDKGRATYRFKNDKHRLDHRIQHVGVGVGVGADPGRSSSVTGVGMTEPMSLVDYQAGRPFRRERGLRRAAA